MNHPRPQVVGYSTLIFDLDGTLSDSREGITRSINHALLAVGLERRPERSLDAMIGPPIDETFRVLAPDFDAGEVATLVAHFRERYADVGYAENRLYDGIAETVATLHAAGQRLGVCTAKRVDFAQRILEMFELTPFFSFIDGGDVGRRKSEQLADLLAHGQIEANAVMIGDRHHDIHAARANGLAAAGVLWGFGSETELQAAHPDMTLARPDELLQLV